MIYTAIYALYSNVVSIHNGKAFDKEGNEVEYDLQAVQAKAEEMQAEEDAKTQAAHDKLTALGLTPEDLQRILG